MNDPITIDGLGHSGATASELEAIQRAGQWMPWAGLGLAVVWWASVAVTVVTSIEPSQFAEAGALSIMAAIALAAVPGLVVLFAGYVAREGARRNAASSLILKAATQLLNPSKAYSDEAQTLAAALKASSEDIDSAMETALSAMKSVSAEMGDERLRLESVTYAAADNARELSSRLADERAALETLTRELREQADAMGETIPRQAAQMVDAARSASIDMAKSDEALEQRLHALKRTGTQITEEFAKIDGMAHTLQKQGDTLVFAVSRLETQLAEAQKTVDDTIRTGDLATNTATETGEAMSQAVGAALAQAKALNAEIHRSARQANDEANRAMAELRQAAEKAAEAIRSANAAGVGRAPADLNTVADALDDAASRVQAAQQPARTPTGSSPSAAAQPARADQADGPEQTQRQGPSAQDVSAIPRVVPNPNGTRTAGPAPRPSADARSGTDPRTVAEPPAIADAKAAARRLEARPADAPTPQAPSARRDMAESERDEAPAALPEPILPDPQTEPQKTVMLTSTRSAGFAQPNAHVPLSSRLNGDHGAANDSEDHGDKIGPDDAARRADPRLGGAGATRAQPGGAPVAITPPARTQAPAGPAGRPQRGLPRLGASRRELETELFEGDDLEGDDEKAAASAWPETGTSEPIVEENIFHANPQDRVPRSMSPGRAPAHTQAHAPAPGPSSAERAQTIGRGINGHGADPTASGPARGLAAPERTSEQAPAASGAAALNETAGRDPLGPPPAGVDVTPSLQGEAPPARPAAASPVTPLSGPTSPRDIREPAPNGQPSLRDADWSTILSEIDREETGQLPREETAESVIQRLETSGIALSQIFRPKAKKKIAAAARKGEQPRRAAIVAAARTEVDRVAKRLIADPELAQLAEDFVSMEEPDAIAALDRTQKSGRNASPRLSAFLLLDAATSSQRAAQTARRA